MKHLYHFGIAVYQLLIYFSSAFNPKAKLWVQGRKNIFNHLKTVIKNDAPLAWFHVSSLGEFEQGRPVIEAFKNKYPQYRILLTFFSPSGYEIRKNYTGADYIFYLPADTPKNAKLFLKITKPSVAFFVKYDFWYNYLYQLHNLKVPTYIFSAIFRPNQLFFKPIGKWYRKMLQFFTVIYVQDEASKNLLKTIEINNVVIGGDTRFDRVVELVQNAREYPLIERFSAGQKVVVAGSTWEKDEELILQYLNTNPQVKWIIAPHEIHQAHLTKIKNLFQDKALFYSQANEQNIKFHQVLIIDSIGMLSALYKYGSVAYIGGGFGKGIHNTLEAATYGVPVVFGPNYHRFKEAVDLINLRAGFPISDVPGFSQIFNEFMNNEPKKREAGIAAKTYVNSMKGGTQKVLLGLDTVL